MTKFSLAKKVNKIRLIVDLANIVFTTPGFAIGGLFGRNTPGA